jgi:hypothetical protein
MFSGFLNLAHLRGYYWSSIFYPENQRFFLCFTSVSPSTIVRMPRMPLRQILLAAILVSSEGKLCSVSFDIAFGSVSQGVLINYSNIPLFVFVCCELSRYWPLGC